MYGCFTCIYVCTPCVSLTPLEARSPLELELNMIMSGHVGSGNQTWFLWKSNQCARLTAEPSLLTVAPFDI